MTRKPLARATAGRADWGRPLPRAAYAGDCLRVARDLIGRVLVCGTGSARVAGRIVEVEAYRGVGDPASHAYRGPTPRTAVMFGPPGYSYVYFTYGMHDCLNIVTEPEGQAAAVLLRALEPLEGVSLMRRRRQGRGKRLADAELARGPGNLTRALGLSRRHSGLDLTRGPLWVSSRPRRLGGRRVRATPRIGIRRATRRRWRFLLEGNPAVSSPPRARAARKPTGAGVSRPVRR